MKYRILQPGEVLQPGDEIHCFDLQPPEWQPVKWSLGLPIMDIDVSLFRRPLGGFTPRPPESAFSRIALTIRRIFLR